MKLKLEQVIKSFDDKEVIRDASFEFESGYIYGLLGRNGAGKTTLFNLINEDLKADSGEIYIVDEARTKTDSDIYMGAIEGEAGSIAHAKLNKTGGVSDVYVSTKENEGTLIMNARPIEAEDIGYVLSTPIVPDFLTGRELLKFFVDINKDRIGDIRSFDEYFDIVDIDIKDRDRLIKDYSHGMKNKMMLLLNIIANPPIWLLDEPLTSFDVVVADEMKELLKSMKKDRLIIFSTHIMELALSLCDRIVLLRDGRLRLLEQGDMSREEFEDHIISVLKDEGKA